MRVAIAEDSVLLREGVARVLDDAGFDVVAQCDNADDLLGQVGIPARRGDPGHPAAPDAQRRGTPGGARAPIQPPGGGRARPLPVRRGRARLKLLADSAEGVGYLLKDRIGDVEDFIASVRRVAEGGSALDPIIVSTLLARQRPDDPIAALTPREREVLELMASGARTRGSRTASSSRCAPSRSTSRASSASWACRRRAASRAVFSPSCCICARRQTPETRPRLASLPSSRAEPVVQALGNVKTRIIQNEPGAGAVRRGGGRGRRRAGPGFVERASSSRSSATSSSASSTRPRSRSGTTPRSTSGSTSSSRSSSSCSPGARGCSSRIFPGELRKWPASRSSRTRSRTPCSTRSPASRWEDRPSGERRERGGRRGRAATDGHRHGLRRRGPLCGVGPVLVRHGPCRCHCRQADRRARPDAADGDRRGDLRRRPSLPDRADRHHALRPRHRLARGSARRACLEAQPAWSREREGGLSCPHRNTTSRPGWATGVQRTGRRRSSAGWGS